jgi:hypothetical protein
MKRPEPEADHSPTSIAKEHVSTNLELSFHSEGFLEKLGI